MPKIVTPLTDTQIKQAKTKDKEYTLPDGDGLELRVRSSDSKRWVFRYQKPFTKQRTNLGLGSYPEVSLADARKKRNDFRKLLKQDIDPKEHKEEQARQHSEAALNTFAHIAANWFEIKQTQISEDHAKDIWRSIELHLIPSLGKLPISKVSAPLTIDVLKPIAAKGSLETVKRLGQRLNEIMTFAVNTGLLRANPLSGIRSAFQKPSKQNMATISPDDLPELVKDISYASIKIVTRCLIEWQLHTMVRPSEAAGTKWSEIDLDNRVWAIPAERMKKKREHLVPLTDQTIAILEMLKPISGHREHVFPADRDPKKHINEQTANMALKRMGYEKRLVAHGLRALASTTLNQHGFDADVVEAALAHVDKNEVRRAYNRSDYFERRRVMMDWWSKTIAASPQQSGIDLNLSNVVSL
ncbi:integrase domain-containing protein [Motilimonas sp. 1_MG-2023]|uniref:integrase domain-containing protein n=1 Tax=Motilimonas sp. 1_MG-2023 TaxID=3062672 RepID=UPI0026E2F26D|nr:integrase domain-containing protein [Motilimonas sp. 1_MG-2023]MDO6525370.1 integrase domain-containing protein [Motilimonas sp. 1_MG-2023]